MSPSATWNEGGCHQVPAAASQATNPGPSAPPSTISATPATQKMLSLCVCVKLLYVRDGMWQSCVCVCECVWSYCMWNYCMLSHGMWQCARELLDVRDGMWQSCVCECVCVKLLYVKFVCVKVLYVKLLYVKFLRVKLLYVRDGMWQSCVCECVWSYCMLSHGMWQCAREAAGGGEGEGARDTESKTRTPHKVVGNNSGSRKREMKINERWSRFQMIWRLCATCVFLDLFT